MLSLRQLARLGIVKLSKGQPPQSSSIVPLEFWRVAGSSNHLEVLHHLAVFSIPAKVQPKQNKQTKTADRMGPTTCLESLLSMMSAVLGVLFFLKGFRGFAHFPTIMTASVFLCDLCSTGILSRRNEKSFLLTIQKITAPMMTVLSCYSILQQTLVY